jgi:hypothetical protein
VTHGGSRHFPPAPRATQRALRQTSRTPRASFGPPESRSEGGPLEGPSDEAQSTLGPDPSRGPPAHRRTAGPGRSLIPQPGGSTSRGRNGGARRSLTAGGGGSPRIEAGARLPGPFVSPPRIAGGIPPRGPRDGARRLPVRGPIRGERRDRSRRGRGPGDSRGFGATGAARADLFSTVFPGTVWGRTTFPGWVTDFPGWVTDFPGWVSPTFRGGFHRLSGVGSGARYRLSGVGLPTFRGGFGVASPALIGLAVSLL